MAHDCSHNDQIHLRHEFLSLMLGTRRAGVSTALNGFDTRGWITHSRGCIMIVDRNALQDFAGGLYGIPEAEYQRLPGRLQPALRQASQFYLPGGAAHTSHSRFPNLQ